VPDWKIRKVAQAILHNMAFILSVFPRLVAKEAIMNKVWANLVASAILPNFFRFSKDVIAE
jgi:hypothetical protein